MAEGLDILGNLATGSMMMEWLEDVKRIMGEETVKKMDSSITQNVGLDLVLLGAAYVDQMSPTA